MNEKALQKLSYGLYLISTEHEGKAAGCLLSETISRGISWRKNTRSLEI